MVDPKKIAIIGAGPAGLTAAYQLSKAGYCVHLYEASSTVGGMCRSLDLWGQRVDLGPHRFFSQDPRINQLWLEVADRQYTMVDRLTRIYYNRKFFNYPLQVWNALRNLGPFEAAHCLAAFLKEKLFPRKIVGDPTFASWVVGRFGQRLFEIFFKSYSEKLWGLPCDELDADFAAQRIKKLSLWEAIKNTLSWNASQKHQTLVDRFAYPIGGTGSIYEKMASQIERHGSKIFLDTPVDSILCNGSMARGLKLSSGEERQYDHIFSTMPLDLVVSRLSDVPTQVTSALQQLTFRNTLLVYLEMDDSNLFLDNWIYIQSKDLQFGRVTNFRNWSSSLNRDRKETILCLEYWANFNDAVWNSPDKELIETAKMEIHKSGLSKNAKILRGHVVRIPRCYPVYRRGYKRHLEIVVTFLKQFQNIQFLGRYGSFKYNNQDHSILMGILAAENFLLNTKHDLWSINTDHEYQEKSKISESGLELSKN